MRLGNGAIGDRNGDLGRRGLAPYLAAMKLDSKYFDSVRIRPASERAAEASEAVCQWKGCHAEAPIGHPWGVGGRDALSVFLDHVRQFNASYNYFEGMSNAEVEAYQKDSTIGHRPTWKVGANSWAHGTRQGATNADVLGHTASESPRIFFLAQRAQQWRRRTAPTLETLEVKSLNF